MRVEPELIFESRCRRLAHDRIIDAAVFDGCFCLRSVAGILDVNARIVQIFHVVDDTDIICFQNISENKPGYALLTDASDFLAFNIVYCQSCCRLGFSDKIKTAVNRDADEFVIRTLVNKGCASIHGHDHKVGKPCLHLFCDITRIYDFIVYVFARNRLIVRDKPCDCKRGSAFGCRKRQRYIVSVAFFVALVASGQKPD